MVIMVGCILRGTHSIEQAISFITTHHGFACYLHCKESIDIIFEHLEVRNIHEFFKCTKFDFMDVVKKIDANFTLDQFTHAFNTLYLREPVKFPSSL
ncbi:unnamed protein product [Caenorhabditis nigoni]